MGVRKYLDGTEDNVNIYTDIFLAGCKYAELTFGEHDTKAEKVKKAIKEVMDKMAKLAAEKDHFFRIKKQLEEKIVEESKKQIDAIGTHELAGSIENFLNQSSGLLDIFARQFLCEMFGYKRGWKHKEIIDYIKAHKDLDKNVVMEIERLVNEDWSSWLKNLIDDRNLHHEANFGLSDMYLVNGKAFMVLTRSNYRKTSDINGYIDIHWQNLFGLTKDLIYLSFCAMNPALKGIILDKNYFLPEEDKVKK